MSDLVEFECDRCGLREWRPRDQEPWLCAACGWMRWSIVEEPTSE